MVHAAAHNSCGGVLLHDHAPQSLADVIAIQAEVGVFAGGQKHHQRHAGHTGPLLAAAAGPIAVFALRGGQVLQAAIVDLAHVARHNLADANRRRLC
jgi:hypothetical protein